MTRAMNIEGIERATGKTWDTWLKFLQRVRAHELSHAEIARKMAEQKGVTSWWAQTITVAYEQHVGKRRPGQTRGGKYRVAVSRTVDGTLDAVLCKWLAVVSARQAFSGVSVERAATTSRSGKYRYWHCGLSDGSRVSVGVSQKARGKAVIGLAHQNLGSPSNIEHWRAFWKSLLARV